MVLGEVTRGFIVDGEVMKVIQKYKYVGLGTRNCKEKITQIG